MDPVLASQHVEVDGMRSRIINAICEARLERCGQVQHHCKTGGISRPFFGCHWVISCPVTADAGSRLGRYLESTDLHNTVNCDGGSLSNFSP